MRSHSDTLRGRPLTYEFEEDTAQLTAEGTMWVTGLEQQVALGGAHSGQW